MPPPPAKQFSGIFVSYRRDDCAGHAGRLSDKLIARFGEDQIFMDVDNIEPGEDFVQVLEKAVSSCEILIAMIGRHWHSRAGETTRLLDNPKDFVRLEIAAALDRNIRVIPVLVQRATMPKPEDLPDDLTRLSRRNAIELSDNRWQRDVDHLIDAIVEIRNKLGVIPQPEPQPGSKPKPEPQPIPEPIPKPGPLSGNWKWLIGGAGLVVVMVIAVIWSIQRAVSQNQPPVSANANTSPSVAEAAKNLEPPAGMVYVPTAEFTMGRDDGTVDERPAHSVRVEGFFIDQHEVTWQQYAEFYQLGKPFIGDVIPRGAEKKPVIYAKWDDADKFCKTYNKRLPTEAEWELAARGTKGYIYPWGNVWQAGLANVNTKSLADVGEFGGLSPYGAVDMVGNAWEWTASTLVAYPNGTLSQPPEPDYKVIRGGSYVDTPREATTTYRASYPERDASDYSKIGFRCVRDITPTSKPK